MKNDLRFYSAIALVLGVSCFGFIGSAKAETESEQLIRLTNQIQVLLKQVQVLQETINTQKMGPDTSMPTTSKGVTPVPIPTTGGSTGIDNTQKSGPDSSLPTTNKGTTGGTSNPTGIDNQQKMGVDSSLPTTNKGATPVPVPNTSGMQTSSTVSMCGSAILYSTNIRKGDSDETLSGNSQIIKDVQDFLSQEGYFTYHTSTGYFGPITESALYRWQRANGINGNGTVIDQTTFNKIKQAVCVTNE